MYVIQPAAVVSGGQYLWYLYGEVMQLPFCTHWLGQPVVMVSGDRGDVCLVGLWLLCQDASACNGAHCYIGLHGCYKQAEQTSSICDER